MNTVWFIWVPEISRIFYQDLKTEDVTEVFLEDVKLSIIKFTDQERTSVSSRDRANYFHNIFYICGYRPLWGIIRKGKHKFLFPEICFYRKSPSCKMQIKMKKHNSNKSKWYKITL